MPLLFAIAGIIALGLSFVALAGPVLLAVAVVRAVRARRRAQGSQPPVSAVPPATPAAEYPADAAFADLISREWPSDPMVLRDRLP